MAGRDLSAELFSAPSGGRNLSAKLFREEPKIDPFTEVAQDQSGLANFLAAMGGSLKGMQIGGKQMLGMADQGEAEQHKAAMRGLESTGSGTAGSIAGQMLPTIPLMPFAALNTLRGAGIVGGSLGALNPTTGTESRLENVAYGGLGGMGGQWAGNKLGTLLAGRANMPSATSSATSGSSSSASAGGGSSSVSANVSGAPTATGSGGGYNFGSVGPDASTGITPAQRELLERISQSQQITDMGGFRVTPGQASGSRPLQQLEAKLESQPMTSGTFNEIKAGNQRTLNRSVAHAIGESADVIDTTVLNQAHDRIGGVYRLVADDRKRVIDPDAFLNNIGRIESDFEGLANIHQNPLVTKLMNLASKGEATGEQLQQLSSQLGKASRQNFSSPQGNRELGMALSDVKSHVDDLLQKGLSGDTAQAFSNARNQYRNLMMIESRQGILNPSTGNVSGANLASALQQKDKGGFLRGRNQSPMYDAARFAQGFKPLVGDSGTATRMPLPSPTDFVLSLPFNVATRAYTSAPVVKAVSNAAAIANGGIMPNQAGKWLGPQLGKAGLLTGGLLGQAQ